MLIDENQLFGYSEMFHLPTGHQEIIGKMQMDQLLPVAVKQG